MLGDKRFIRTIRLQNFLSFGAGSTELELKSLNVIIGPNASGKSNLIEAIDFIRSSASDLTKPILAGGGIDEWLWKGTKNPTAEIDVTAYYPNGSMPLRHRIAFRMNGQRFQLEDEAIENEYPDNEYVDDVRFYYRYQRGYPVLNIRRSSDSFEDDRDVFFERKLRREDLAPDQSVLSQRKDPDQYPEITYLGNQYSDIKIYTEWNFGRYTSPRLPQKPDLPNDFLSEDLANLGLVLNDLQDRPGLQKRLRDELQEFYEGFTNISTRIRGGTVQITLMETSMNQPIPATRLSDGTLRYLCLLSILCHPDPPPLIAIEEPELGLHPDIMPNLAKLLIEASHRTQLIITTHSTALIDALSDVPEAVIVCEKVAGATTMQRLNENELRIWLDDYALGQLWRRGEIGGNRW